MKRLVLMALVLAACGGGEAATTTSPPAEAISSLTTVTTPTPPGVTTSTHTVQVFYGTGGDCAVVEGHDRTITSTAGIPVIPTLEALVAGPTAGERTAGAFSFFGPQTAEVLIDATLVDGSLTVDFTDFSQIIPNASASCGSANLVAELTTTVFQFPEVQSVAYTFDGSSEAFGAFLQTDGVSVARSDWPPTTTTLPAVAGGTTFNTSTPLEPLPGSAGATGSGCAPGGDELADGVWFGKIETVSVAEIGFDLACWYSGDAANVAATEGGLSEVPVPNDFYIRNEVATLRTVAVAPDAVIHWFPTTTGELALEVQPWDEWIAAPSGYLECPGAGCNVWLYVNEGSVTEVQQQYTP